MEHSIAGKREEREEREEREKHTHLPPPLVTGSHECDLSVSGLGGLEARVVGRGSRIRRNGYCFGCVSLGGE